MRGCRLDAILRRLGLARASRVAKWRSKYEQVWLDHIARCECHDSWDQCPCSESGHTPLRPNRSIHECVNNCCRWCG